MKKLLTGALFAVVVLALVLTSSSSVDANVNLMVPDPQGDRYFFQGVTVDDGQTTGSATALNVAGMQFPYELDYSNALFLPLGGYGNKAVATLENMWHDDWVDSCPAKATMVLQYRTNSQYKNGDVTLMTRRSDGSYDRYPLLRTLNQPNTVQVPVDMSTFLPNDDSTWTKFDAKLDYDMRRNTNSEMRVYSARVVASNLFDCGKTQ